MSTSHQYEVNLNWSEQRKGIVHSPVLNESIEVATPPEFPMGMPGIWSPEHLFVAAVSSCLMTTFLAIAENSKLVYTHFECNAVGTLEQVDGKYRVSEILLKPIITLATDQNSERALRVIQMAEKHCLISNSIHSTVHLEPEVRLAAS